MDTDSRADAIGNLLRAVATLESSDIHLLAKVAGLLPLTKLREEMRAEDAKTAACSSSREVPATTAATTIKALLLNALSKLERGR